MTENDKKKIALLGFLTYCVLKKGTYVKYNGVECKVEQEFVQEWISYQGRNVLCDNFDKKKIWYKDELIIVHKLELK